ncbi:heterokaryon incompatibility protein 6, OR allele [Aspergillus awamori]|uniref:Heterokaryon incompatibility protein 6, OR allele n=1 Tax=Aspergillus awamori TaxID=105351 RepID=A0A401L602_ASPAW|nr:heterokaryon incompatibility protein 6, OR allele [Aspergillus awamori]GKZ59262.1 hypothetical protein AnigIFM49718_005126 [Aspergillus niger]
MPLSYDKLDSSANQIRLLTIIPDENDESPVRGSLHTVSLNDTCDFDALSYVWGDTSVTVDISVDDCLVGVTPNLHAFLRRLRQPKTGRTVWVDYVCINQNDISERNSQVALMCQIYSTARSVVAWLGDLAPEALELIEWYHANRTGFYFESTGFNIIGAISWLSLCANALCCAQYWHRLWTFQEWHLSRNAPVCMHGKATFTIGNIFSRLHEEALVARRRITDDIVLGILSTLNTLEPPEDSKTLIILELQQKLGKLVNNIPRDVLRLNPGTSRLSGLGDLLLLTLDRQCSNELDKVYALYGLSPVVRQTYHPDYRKTISQVNHETTSFILGHEANMNIFDEFDFYLNPLKKDESLPSWTLDFTMTDPEHRAKMQHSFKTLNLDKALWEQRQDHTPIITGDMQTLKLWCRQVGFSAVPYLLYSKAFQCLWEVQMLAKAFMEDVKDSIYFWDRREAMIKATYYYANCSKIVPLNTFFDFMKYCISDEDEQFWETTRGYSTALYLASQKLEEQRFFPVTTPTGITFGFTNCEIEPFDHLVIPCGIAQVFVLRPIPKEMLVDGEEVQCFKVIGRAYVEGISDREEAMPDPLRSEMEKTSPKLFCLR